MGEHANQPDRLGGVLGWGTVEPGPSVGVGGRLTAAQPDGKKRIPGLTTVPLGVKAYLSPVEAKGKGRPIDTLRLTCRPWRLGSMEGEAQKLFGLLGILYFATGIILAAVLRYQSLVFQYYETHRYSACSTIK